MKESLRETTAHGNPDFPFALYHIHRLRQTAAFSLHWHDEVEFIHVQQGRLNLTIDNTEYLGLPGDIFVVNSRQIHEMSVTEVPTIYVTALFPLGSLLFLQEDAVNREFLLPLAQNRLRFPNRVTDLPIAPVVWERLERITALFHEKGPCHMLQIRVLLLEILCEFFTASCLLAPAGEPGRQDKHRRILAYIARGYLGELPLEQTAAEFHMVPKYFSRYFKRTFHTSYTDYVNYLRLEYASDLLRHTELPVTEIALRSGFNSSSYFNKKFQCAYGKTPTEYRRG